MLALEQLAHMGAIRRIIGRCLGKRGEYGAALFTPMGHFLAPAFLLEEVVDPTGAGDTFAGGFLGFLAATERMDFHTLKMAAMVGTIMASFTVEKFGTSGLETLSKAALDARLAEFRNLITI